MLLAGRKHTTGDKRRWVIHYCDWLQEHQQLSSVVVASNSSTLTVGDASVRDGRDVIFFTNGGTTGETATITVTVTCTDTEIKIDTIQFTVVAP